MLTLILNKKALVSQGGVMVCSKGDIIPVEIQVTDAGELCKMTVEPRAEVPQAAKKNPLHMCGPYVPVPEHLRIRLRTQVDKYGPTEVARRIGCSGGTVRRFLDGGNTKAAMVKAVTQYLNAHAGAYNASKQVQDGHTLPGVFEVGS